MIPFMVRDEQELYDVFDPSGLSLSGNVTAYLSDYMEDRRPGEHVCLEVTAEYAFDAERFRKAYLLYIQKLQARSRREIGRCNLCAVRLLLIGVVFIVIGIALASRMNEVAAAIISTIGSFAVTVTALLPGPTATGFEQAASMKANSAMFRKAARPSEVVKAGLRAMRKGKVLRYVGGYTGGMNLLSRILPRSAARKYAGKMNRE